MARADYHDPEDPDLDPDDEDDEDEEDDEDDEDGDDDEDEEEPEDAAAPAPPVAIVENNPVAGIFEPAPPLPKVEVAAQAAPPPVRSTTQGRPARVGTWLPLSNDRVGTVLVYRAGSAPGGYLYRLRPPFPAVPLERWILNAAGPGKYRLLQRGHPPEREYIGSLTLTVSEESATAAAPRPAPAADPNANGNGTVSVPAQVPPGTDYRLALVTVGLPILAGVASEFAKAIAQRPQRSELDTLLQAAKLLQTPNEERTALLREGIKLVRDVEAEAPRGNSGGGDLFNVRDLFAGLGEVVRAWRESRPAPAAAPNGAALGKAAPASPAAGELQAVQGETSEQFVERVLVTEIRRAVGSADTPDCFVTLVLAWLPSHVIAWIEGSPDEEVLEKLPSQFPAHADYLREPVVQNFLRSALQMLREDNEEEPVVRERSRAGVAG